MNDKKLRKQRIDEVLDYIENVMEECDEKVLSIVREHLKE